MGILGWLLLVMTAALVVVIVTALVVRGQLRRSNRVAARIKGHAPVVWLWSPTRSARLHRRLHQAAAPIDPSSTNNHLPEAPGTDRLRLELTEEAVAVDDWLVWASRLRGRGRRAHLAEIASQVDTIEDLSGRLLGWRSQNSSQQDPSGPAAPRLAALDEEIDHLAAARAELRSVG